METSLIINMKETDIGERIKELISHFGLTANSFSAKFGISQKNISNTVSGRNKPSAALLSEIIKKTKVSGDWLLTGEGSMFEIETPNARIFGRIADLEWIELPMLDAKAAAHYCDNIDRPLYKQYTGKLWPVLKIPGNEYKDAVVIDIDGDSMEPLYKHGTKVIGRLVPEGWWPYAKGIYAVSTKDSQFTIKEIIENNNNLLILKPINPAYETKQYELKDVLCMFKIGEVVFAPAE